MQHNTITNWILLWLYVSLSYALIESGDPQYYLLLAYPWMVWWILIPAFATDNNITNRTPYITAFAVHLLPLGFFFWVFLRYFEVAYLAGSVIFPYNLRLTRAGLPDFPLLLEFGPIMHCLFGFPCCITTSFSGQGWMVWWVLIPTLVANSNITNRASKSTVVALLLLPRRASPWVLLCQLEVAHLAGSGVSPDGFRPSRAGLLSFPCWNRWLLFGL